MAAPVAYVAAEFERDERSRTGANTAARKQSTDGGRVQISGKKRTVVVSLKGPVGEKV